MFVVLPCHMLVVFYGLLYFVVTYQLHCLKILWYELTVNDWILHASDEKGPQTCINLESIMTTSFLSFQTDMVDNSGVKNAIDNLRGVVAVL